MTGELTWSDVVVSERLVLMRYLRKNSEAVIRNTEGLRDEQLRQPGVPSGTNLLGIVHHLTGVEEHWFQRVFLGTVGERDKSMDAPPGATRDEVVAASRRACARSDEIVDQNPDLSTMAVVENPGEEDLDSLRVIIAHMVEETARHAGQADILRELIDGATEL